MKRSLMFATLSMALATSSTFAQSELEILRARCAEQERQIRQLEEENSRLRAPAAEAEAPAAHEADAPASEASPAPVAAAAAPANSVYVIKPGDSWRKIASKTGVPAATLAKLNGLKANAMIHPGQKLQLPAPAAAAPAADTPAVAASTTAPGGRTHKIEQGDTFSSISRKYSISTAALIAANPNVKPSALRLGQLINLGAAPAPAPATSTPVVETPAATPAATAEAAPAPAPVEAPPVRSGKPVAVMIEGEITYGDFAAKHGTDVERLNSLNGLDLTTATVLAKGSELYVPGD